MMEGKMKRKREKKREKGREKSEKMNVGCLIDCDVWNEMQRRNKRENEGMWRRNGDGDVM